MTPKQRRAHLAVWLLMAPALLGATIALLLLLPAPVAPGAAP